MGQRGTFWYAKYVFVNTLPTIDWRIMHIYTQHFDLSQMSNCRTASMLSIAAW